MAKKQTGRNQLVTEPEMRLAAPMARCAYCFGNAALGETRKIVRENTTLYVHNRHPRRADEGKEEEG